MTRVDGKRPEDFAFDAAQLEQERSRGITASPIGAAEPTLRSSLASDSFAVLRTSGGPDAPAPAPLPDDLVDCPDAYHIDAAQEAMWQMSEELTESNIMRMAFVFAMASDRQAQDHELKQTQLQTDAARQRLGDGQGDDPDPLRTGLLCLCSPLFAVAFLLTGKDPIELLQGDAELSGRRSQHGSASGDPALDAALTAQPQPVVRAADSDGLARHRQQWGEQQERLLVAQLLASLIPVVEGGAETLATDPPKQPIPRDILA